MAPRVCLLTVHGIGFQQRPAGGREGYADGLHAHLRTALGRRLGEDCEAPADPRRPPGGAVYVESEWRHSREAGLARLDRKLIATGNGAQIAHVALVYSPSLPPDSHLEATVEIAARAALAFSRYTSPTSALRMVGRDLWALVHHPRPQRQAASNLRPRTDVSKTGSSRSPNVLRAIEADVATYVCRNDLRERVRGFVQQAIQRLLDSGNIDRLVVNAHSQGSVLCWDVLCRLPLSSWSRQDPSRATKLRAFVTAGSPIRKYVDLFDWGGQVGQMAALSMPPFVWQNYWDACDPVADPLNPPVAWKPGQSPRSPQCAEEALLVAVDPDSGGRRHFVVDDRRVDNVRNSSGGGLQAHEYWNNQAEFVTELASLLVNQLRS